MISTAWHRVPLLLSLVACASPERPLPPVAAADVSSQGAVSGEVPVTAMAPLVIGRLEEPFDPAYEAEWAAFEQELRAARALGVDAVSVDVWWGSVERQGDGVFDFRWVDRVAKAIIDAGLDFRPVLAFHSCGTNVGDTCSVPLPGWLFERYRGREIPGVGLTIDSPDDLLYVSSQGNVSQEALSVWVTPLVLEQYREFVEAFVARYEHLAGETHAIAVGLGSASELRYPSYNAHDQDAGYPGPGVLQSFSAPARASFRAWVLAKYGGLAGARTAWGRPLVSEDAVDMPTEAELDGFFARGEHLHTRYGQDLFEWYRASLLEHGRQVLSATAEVIQSSAFRGVRLNARIPGVHWRAGDTRRAELSAGLISTSDSATWTLDGAGHGYAALVGMVASVRQGPLRPNVALDFTCLEKENGEGGEAVASRAESLVFWVADEAQRQGVPIGGENALNGGLWTEQGWARIRNALTWSHYDELTLLRLHDVVSSPIARREVARISSAQPRSSRP